MDIFERHFPEFVRYAQHNQGVVKMDSTLPRIRLAYALSGLVLVAYLSHCLALNYVVDDSFITFRYVKNFVNGSGLVFNPGERVEGYTNFLWAMLLSPFLYANPKINLLLVAQVLGIVFGMATILLVVRFSSLINRPFGPLSVVAAAFLAFNSSFSAWSTGGLETTLFTFLVFAGGLGYVYFLQTGKKQLVPAVLFALAAMTRPEGILVFGLTSLHFFATEFRSGRQLISRRTLGWLVAFLLIYAPYFLWRLNYYGYPLPNTFYAKLGSRGGLYDRGFRYVLNYVEWSGAFVFLLALPLLINRIKEAWVSYFLLLVGAYVLYVIYVGGDGLAFFRFIVPVTPFMYLLVQEGLRDCVDWATKRRILRTEWATPALACLILVVSLAFTGRQSLAIILFPDSQRWYEPQSELSFPGTGRDHSYISFDNYFVDRQAIAAKWLEANAAPDALVASTPAGSIAYNMHLNVIDMLGLNDLHISHARSSDNARTGWSRAGHDKGDGKYVLSRSPDYILLGNVAVLPRPLSEQEMSKKLVRQSEFEIWDDPEFHRDYEIVSVKLSDEGVFKYFTFYRKKASTISQDTQRR